MAINKVTATINNQTINLTLNTSTGKYEAVISAPNESSYNLPNHVYPIIINATDTAGNSANKNATIRVKETAAPICAITYPTAGALIINNKPSVTATFRDSESGIDKSTIIFQIDNINLTPILSDVSGGVNLTYTPSVALVDGKHTVKINCLDNDGNASTIISSEFKIDTVPPVLNVSSPVNNLTTNLANVLLLGMTNDTVSSPVSVSAMLNGASLGEIIVKDDGTFSKEFILSQEGENTLIVTSTDSAGKSSSITRKILYDITDPEIGNITIVPDPVNTSGSFTIVVEVSD